MPLRAIPPNVSLLMTLAAAQPPMLVGFGVRVSEAHRARGMEGARSRVTRSGNIPTYLVQGLGGF